MIVKKNIKWQMMWQQGPLLKEELYCNDIDVIAKADMTCLKD